MFFSFQLCVFNTEEKRRLLKKQKDKTSWNFTWLRKVKEDIRLKLKPRLNFLLKLF